MKKFKVPGCLRSCFSLGCLGFGLLVILAIVLIWKKPLNTTIFNIREQNQDKSAKLLPDRPIVLKVVLLSDSEGVNDMVKRVLMYAKDENIDYVFHLGDLTHLGVPESFKELKELFDSFEGLNIYTVPGDRDLWKSKGISSYETYFGNSYRYETINGVNFLFIDNANEYEGISDKQWSFIEEHISTSDFILIHNVLIPTGVPLVGNKIMGEYDRNVSEQRTKLLSMIRESNVKAVFSGDQHYYSETTDKEKPSLKQYVLGTVNVDRSMQAPSFAVLTIYEDGSYSVEKIVLGN